MTSQTAGPTIIAAYDGSASSRAAVEHAIDLALPDGRVVLVHAYEVPSDFIGASYYNAMFEDVKEHATAVLDALERDCDRLNTVAHERDLCLGPPAAAIIAAAEDADHIVLGSRGVGRIRGLVGSVAHDVLHRAHCPVTVIPDRMVAEAGRPVEAATA
jgi:nucleotide-binding universal stress UspA family protein